MQVCTSEDMEAVRAIYNHYVHTSTSTFDLVAQSEAQRLDWWKEHQREGLPVVVAESGTEIVAWGSLSYYHQRCAYKTTIEPSMYVHRDHTAKGIGRELFTHLLGRAQEHGYHCLVGLICSENDAGLKFCESFGFERIGELKEVGRKFDRWLNVIIVQKMLAES